MNKNNYCLIVGNLGGDPVEKGRSQKVGLIVTFSVAENVQSFDETSGTYKTTHTNWFPVTLFGGLAERAVRSLKKGERVIVQGRMKISKYTDKVGEEKSGFEILATDVA